MELRGQPANPDSPGKLAVKTVCMCCYCCASSSKKESVSNALQISSQDSAK